MALVAHLASSQVGDLTVNAHMTASAFDVYLTAVNNIFYVSLLLMPAFLLLVGDVVTSDQESGYSRIAVTRVGSRRGWLFGKVMAVAITALVFQALLVSVCLAAGVWRGYPMDATASEVARFEMPADADFSSEPLFFPARTGSDMAVRAVSTAAYLALAFACTAVLLIAIGIFRPRSGFALATWIAVALADVLVNWLTHIEWYALVSPTLHLIEGAHTSLAGPLHPTWATSIVLYLIVLASGLWLGDRLIRGAEL